MAAVTSTHTVQLPLAGMFIPAKLTLVMVPAALLNGMVPEQVPRLTPPSVKVCAAAVVVIPKGKVSLKEAPETARLFGLVRVKTIVEVPLLCTVDWLKTLAMVAGPITSRLVLAPAPAMAVSLEVAPLVVLGYPATGLMAPEVTVTLMVQLSLALRVAMVGLMAVPPTLSAGEKVTALAQVLEKLVEASVMLLRGSVKWTLVSAFTALRLVTVKVSVVIPPTEICPGAKFLASCGGRSTLRVATGEAAPATGLSVAVAPEVWLLLEPATLLVSGTVTVQLLPAAMLGMVRFSEVAPTMSEGLAVVPAQVPPMVVPATVMLTRGSVKLTLVTGMPLVLLRVKVTVLVAFWAMVDGVNDLPVMDGATTTLRVAVLDALPAAPLSLAATPEAELL